MTLRVTPAEIVERAESSGNAGLLAKAEHWSRIRLGDVAQVVNGSPFKSSLFNVDGVGMPLIRIRDVGAVGPSTWYKGPFDESHKVRRQDILVGMDGDFRLARWSSGDALLNQRVCRIDVDTTRFDDRFLELLLQGYLDAIWDATSSTTVKHLSSRSIADIPLPFPEMDEQCRIVDILGDHLSRLDSANDSMSKSHARLRLLQESWLSVHLGAPPSSELTTIADCLLESRGGWSRSKKHLVSHVDGVPYLKMNNISRAGELVLDDVVHVRAYEDDLKRYAIEPGDVLFNSKNSGDLIGKTAVATDSISGWTFNENIMRLRFDKRVQPQFAGVWFLAPVMRQHIRKAASASTNVAAVYKNQLVTMPIWVPSAATQSRLIAEYTSIADASTYLQRELVAALRRSKSLRRSLLVAAFAGRLTGRASDLDVVEELSVGAV